jgi:hypothetical protein
MYLYVLGGCSFGVRATNASFFSVDSTFCLSNIQEKTVLAIL